MFVQTSVTSKAAYSNSKGKEQTSYGKPKIFKSIPDNGDPMLRIEIARSHTVGTGSRGGSSQLYDDIGRIWFDKEALTACIRCGVENGIINIDDIFSDN